MDQEYSTNIIHDIEINSIVQIAVYLLIRVDFTQLQNSYIAMDMHTHTHITRNCSEVVTSEQVQQFRNWKACLYHPIIMVTKNM